MRNRARTRKRPNERRRCAIGLASDARADPDRPGGVCDAWAKGPGSRSHGRERARQWVCAAARSRRRAMAAGASSAL